MHPYFVFDNVPFVEGYVEAIGFVDGEMVARHRVCSHGKGVKMDIVVDDKYARLEANDNDFVFVNAKILDENGNLDYGFTGEVVFFAENGSFIGTDRINAIAGVATVLLKATGDVTVTAKSGEMTATTVVKTEK